LIRELLDVAVDDFVFNIKISQHFRGLLTKLNAMREDNYLFIMVFNIAPYYLRKNHSLSSSRWKLVQQIKIVWSSFHDLKNLIEISKLIVIKIFFGFCWVKML